MISLTTLFILSKCYEHTGDYLAAEQNLLLATQMVPYNLESRYLLANLYMECGNLQKAFILAKCTLNIPVKVQSPETDEIRTGLEEIIAKINSQN